MTNFHSTGTLSKFRFSNIGGGASSRQQDQLDVTLHVTSGSRASQSRALSLTTQAWATVKDLKDQIGKALAIPPSAQRLHDLSGPLSHHGRELPNRWTLLDITDSNSNTLELLLHDTRDQADGGPRVASSSADDPTTTSPKLQPSRSVGRIHQPSDISIVPTLQPLTPKVLFQALHQCRAGFAAGFKPVLSIDGSGGAYFLHDAYKHKVAVFKPADEEPYAANNPRGYVNTNRSICQQLDQEEADPFSLRAGIIPGESCLREVAAFLLDHDGISGVPPTTLVEARHEGFHNSGTRLKVYEGGASIGQHVLPTTTMEQSPMEKTTYKIGSFQEFVQAECTMDDLSPSKISTEEVQKIAILDIRLMNADRNTANLLCRRRKKRRGDSSTTNSYEDDSFELVPIDHGYCLRSVCDVSWFDWCWLDWPQVKQPLSHRLKEYVDNLNIEQDVQLLKNILKISDGPKSKALYYFRASSMLLQAGVKAGLSIFDIANKCCRSDNAGEEPSKLELIVDKSLELALLAIENGKWHPSLASRALEHQLAVSSVHNKLFLKSTSSAELKTSDMTPFSDANYIPFVIGSDAQGLLSSSTRHSSPLPESENTSGSDDDEEEEEEEDNMGFFHDDDDCEQWAASVLLGDVSLDVTRRNRSSSDLSTSSNDCSSTLSQSPAGFWQVPPSKIMDRPSVLRSSSSLSAPTSSNFSSEATVDRKPMQEQSKGRVDFDEFNDFMKDSRGNSELNNDLKIHEDVSPIAVSSPLVMFSPNHQASPDVVLPLNRLANAHLKRSQSYCAFSFEPIHHDTKKHLLSQSVIRWSDTAHSSQLHEYCLKFIDLLITREVIGLVNHPKK